MFTAPPTVAVAPLASEVPAKHPARVRLPVVLKAPPFRFSPVPEPPFRIRFPTWLAVKSCPAPGAIELFTWKLARLETLPGPVIPPLMVTPSLPVP